MYRNFLFGKERNKDIFSACLTAKRFGLLFYPKLASK